MHTKYFFHLMGRASTLLNKEPVALDDEDDGAFWEGVTEHDHDICLGNPGLDMSG